MTGSYFDDLAALLRERGVPDEEVAGTVDDLSAYVTEAGADPLEEFGPPADFAEQLSPSRGDEPGPEADPTAETWLWTADAFQERERLNQYGDQGWEVERIDSAARFVSRRDPLNPLRWEYRRESILPGRRRATAARLAPDGWEPCGSWMHFEYFKRPKAATDGPSAALGTVPETPARSRFWGKRFYLFIAAYFLILLAISATWLTLGNGNSKNGFLWGVIVGSALGLLILISQLLRNQRRP